MLYKLKKRSDMEVKNRVEKLREWMSHQGVSAMIIPSTDPHCGEYVPHHWEVRKWISGFTGSAGTAVITLDKAALWTDSRYFIQAAEQLDGTEFQLMKERIQGTPSICEWLEYVLPAKSIIAVCGEMYSHQEFEEISQGLKNGLKLISFDVPFSEIWENRPELPTTQIYEQPFEFSGTTTKDKLNAIRELLNKENTTNILLSALDEIAWVTNLRGNDVHCNPVFVSYLLISKNSATLYINKSKVSTEIRETLSIQGINCQAYEDIFRHLSQLKDIWIDPATTNQAIYKSLECKPLEKKSPVSLLKAVKNKQEIEGFKKAMLRDGVAMVKFLKWLHPAVKAGNQTELSISKKLESLRAEQENYLGISFDTIAAYAHHGAIVHYEPDEISDIPVKSEGFLLLDSGAQYKEGTTDITRTISLGPVTQEMKEDYTLVLRGFIQLGLAKFPEGTCGTQLDVLARQFMWKAGKNYLHGTGHGVGSHLCVHEGPHQIRMNNVPAVLRAGMTVTDEPGLYLEGKYGIRTENTLLITPYLKTDFGKYLQFEHLTLCPIDMRPVLLHLLNPEEKEWINEYHKHVYEELTPYLNIEEKEWLKEATKTI